MKTDKILLFTLCTLLVLRIILLFFNIHFTSVYGEEIFIFSLSLIGFTVWMIRLHTNNGRIILFGSAVGVYGLLYIIVSFFNAIFIKNERHPVHFKNTDKMVCVQPGFGIGCGPYMLFGMGKTYLWGLLYQEDVSCQIISEGPPRISGAFEIPNGLKDPRGRDCWFWKERNWLFDCETNTFYQLKKRKPIKLSKREQFWLSSWEKTLNAQIFIGKGTSDIEEIYQLPTTIYVTLNFYDNNYVKKLDNSTIEGLTKKIAESLKLVINNVDRYKTIETYFITEDSRNIYVPSKYDFDENQQYKKGCYNLETNTIVPNVLGVDYIKFLYIPWTPFLSINNNGRNKNQEAMRNNLSSELFHIEEIGSVLKTEEIQYKGMACEVYEGKNSWRIRLKNGYMTNSFRFVLYEGEVIEATMNYSCFKTNNRLTYGEIVDKLTYKNSSTGIDKQYYKYVSRDYLKFYFETSESLIHCEADTSSFPWKISYTTSITEPQFMYLYKEN